MASFSSRDTADSEIMISHGDAVCRNFRLCISGVEAGLLSGQAALEAVPETLRRATELRGDQLHLSEAAVDLHSAKLGGSNAGGLRVRREGEPANHAYSAPQECGASHGAFPENDRPATDGAPPRADSVPIGADHEMRRGAPARLPGIAARRPALRLRIPPRVMARGARVRGVAAAECVVMRGGERAAGSAGSDHRGFRLLPAAQA